jgi:hypothetical protein
LVLYTVVHQPRSEIWTLFDNVLLLTKGTTAYSGPASECIPYFARLGYELPPFVNPAEHVIDLIAVDTRSEELESSSSLRVESLKQAWTDCCNSLAEKAADQAANQSQPRPERSRSLSQAHHAGFVRQTWVLIRRTWTTTIRDPMGMFGSLVEAVGMALINGWIFYKLDGSQAGIRSRLGALYVPLRIVI